MKNTIKTKNKYCLAGILCALVLATLVSAGKVFAEIPPPEKLLPDDTLVVVTIPDFAKMRQIYATSPQFQLLNDPAMQPFKDKLISKLKEELVKPLERELGVSLSDYKNLPQGQITFAMTQNNWQGTSSELPAFLILLDTKSQSSQLKTDLDNLKKKWLDSGKSIKTEKIRDTDFSILPVSQQDIPASVSKLISPSGADSSGDDATNNATKSNLVIGQYDSLLLIGNSTKAIEKVVAHLTGSSMPALADVPSFDSSRLAMFRDAPFYGWVNLKTLIDFARKSPDKDSDSSGPFGSFDMNKIISATGLGGLTSLAFNFQNSPDGTLAQFSLGVPDSGRKGLFKILPGEPKESGPPPFVPADAVKFQRWRLDGQKAWATIQQVLSDISPQAQSTLNFILDSASAAQKQKDPDFDIRKNLFGNLGDDMISYEKAPKGTSLADLTGAPSLFLLGSPHPDQLVSALKSILVLMNRQGGDPTEREFLGRKIYSIPTPALPNGDPSKPPGTLSYAATGSYVAMSTDASMLEEFLRSSDGQQKSLRDTPGLVDATAKVGGSSTGLFGYQNQAATTKVYLEALRNSASSDSSPTMLAPGIPAFVPKSVFKEWLDFSLLPPFERISKYFYFSVYAASANSEGLTFKIYSPMPPQLR